MLFLKRNEMQDVVVTAPDGQTIRFRVARVVLWEGRMSGVTVGIDAPRGWGIHREEIAQPQQATA